jgi:hypothetical protein
MPACELDHPSASTTQPADARRLVVTWQHPGTRKIAPIGFLSYDGHVYRFMYIRNVTQVEGFQPLLGFERLDRSYESNQLFPLFAQRVMAPRRPDYQQYVSRLGLDGDPDPWEQITRSQGRREGDALQFLPEPTVNGGVLSALFLGNGLRHMPAEVHRLNGKEIRVSVEQVEAALRGLSPGDLLDLAAEPENQKNRLAIMVTAPSLVPVGWVPDLLLDDLHRLLENANVTVSVEHANGPDAPSHIRLLVRLTASLTDDFRFFSGDCWAPLGAPG